MASNSSQAMLDKFAEVSAKVGNQVHLRSLRDAFATITPLYILAGVAVLINNVIFPLFFKAGSPELARGARKQPFIDAIQTLDYVSFVEEVN